MSQVLFFFEAGSSFADTVIYDGKANCHVNEGK